MFPKMLRVRQTFPARKIENVASATANELAGLRLDSRVRTGDTVAVTAGSRGISEITAITKAVVDTLKSTGARPFIVPAM